MFCVYRRNEKSYWECSMRRGKTFRCPAMVIQVGSSFQRGTQNHIHELGRGLLSKLQVTKTVRQTAKADVFAPATNIVTDAMQDAGDMVDVPNLDNMVTASNYFSQYVFKRLTLR